MNLREIHAMTVELDMDVTRRNNALNLSGQRDLFLWDVEDRLDRIALALLSLVEDEPKLGVTV